MYNELSDSWIFGNMTKQVRNVSDIADTNGGVVVVFELKMSEFLSKSIVVSEPWSDHVMQQLRSERRIFEVVGVEIAGNLQ